MQLRIVTAGGTRWDECLAFIAQHDNPMVPLPWTIDPNLHFMWELSSNEGGTFDEVTEEMTGRPLMGVLVARMMEHNPRQTHIVVHRSYRMQGWGTRMLRWMLNTQAEYATVNVDIHNHEAVGFAMRRGRIMDTRIEQELHGTMRGYYQVRFTLNAPMWAHAGCRCAQCRDELSSLTTGSVSSNPWE